MAQTIFKEWFGKYQIGDELPEGWRVGKLRDLAEKFQMETNQEKRCTLKAENVLFNKRYQMNGISNKKLLVKKKLLITKLF